MIDMKKKEVDYINFNDINTPIHYVGGKSEHIILG